jgi:hypothetical protein
MFLTLIQDLGLIIGSCPSRFEIQDSISEIRDSRFEIQYPDYNQWEERYKLMFFIYEQLNAV